MIPLSALILTQNEEKKIERCIRSLHFCAEIIVVDGGSTDCTLEKLANLNSQMNGKIRVYENPWPGFSHQRNFSLSKASQDWVLIVDADEKISSELSEKLSAMWSNPSQLQKKSCYKIRRQEYFFGRPYHFGVGNPSFQDRLFKKAGIQYVGDLHEHPNFSENPGLIEEPILHDPDLEIETILRKINSYSALDAQRLYHSGRRTNIWGVLLSGPAMFFKNLIYYEAWRDGTTGVLVSIVEGLNRTVRHLKLWELQKK